MEWDGQVLLYKNFITQDECRILNEWVESAIEKNQFVLGVTGDWFQKSFKKTPYRLTNRMVNDIEYCPLVYQLQNRIREEFNIVKDAPIIPYHGRDGVVVSCTMNQGDVYKHKDPSVGEGLSGARFNILSSNAEEGGLIHVGENTYDLNDGDLMAYLVTDLYHSVDKCYGNKMRNMFMFGFMVPEGVDLV